MWFWIIFVLYKMLPALFDAIMIAHMFLPIYPIDSVIDCVPVAQENYKLIFWT